MTDQSPTKDSKEITAILEHLVGHFAYKDEDGNWWGHDTNVGKCTQDFAAAVRSIKGQNLYHRNTKLKLTAYKNLGDIDRTAIAKVIWGNWIPAWWKGSRGEWEILELIAKVKNL